MRNPFKRQKAPVEPTEVEKAHTTPVAMTSQIPAQGGWNTILESFTGAWQHNVEIRRDVALVYHTTFACMSLIASDLAKLDVQLKVKKQGQVAVINVPAIDRLLDQPNPYQTWGQFAESWFLSKLSTGNAYIIKQRTNGVVTQLDVLDPSRVRVLVGGGMVFYELSPDNLLGTGTTITVPESEIIHDRFNCLFHPLMGLSPIAASGLAAMQGHAIQNNATNLFRNASMPGGILTAPGEIKKETAERLKANWEEKYKGRDYGRVAVLGDGLDFKAMSINAVDAQLIEQLKWTSEVICSTFHVPAYKVGVGALPSYNNVESLNVEYYSQCLQGLMEAMEACLDKGLTDRPVKSYFEMDIKGLLRTDATTLMKYLKEGVSAGVLSPNEARAELGLGPVVGGESPYLQQQNYSLADLAARGAAPEPTPKGMTSNAYLKLRLRTLENRLMQLGEGRDEEET